MSSFFILNLPGGFKISYFIVWGKKFCNDYLRFFKNFLTEFSESLLTCSSVSVLSSYLSVTEPSLIVKLIEDDRKFCIAAL